MTQHASIAGRAARAASAARMNTCDKSSARLYRRAYKLSRLAYELATDQPEQGK